MKSNLLIGLILTVSILATASYAQERKLESFFDHFDTVSGLDPVYVEFLTTGTEAFEAGNFKQALELFQKAAEVEPNRWQAHEFMAVCYLKLGQLDDAIPCIERVVKIEERIENLSWLVVTLSEKTAYDRALPFAKRWVEIRPQERDAHHYLFQIYYNLRQYDKAITECQTCNRIRETADTYQGLGDCYFKKKDSAKALGYYEKALQLEPNQSSLYGNIGMTCYLWGKYDDAIEAFQTELDKATDSRQKERCRFGMAISYLAQGEFDKASQLLGKRPYIGVQLAKSGSSIKVSAVLKNGPADVAGIHADDIIVSFNEIPIIDMEPEEFIEHVNKAKFGSTAETAIDRGGVIMKKKLIVGVTPDLPELMRALETTAAAPPVATPSAVPAAPSLEIHTVTARPARLSPGEKFTVEVRCTVCEPAMERTKVPLQFSYSILSGTKVVYRGKPEKLNAPNKERWTITKRMTAAKKRGDYIMRVSLRYNNVTVEEAVNLRIE